MFPQLVIISFITSIGTGVWLLGAVLFDCYFQDSAIYVQPVPKPLSFKRYLAFAKQFEQSYNAKVHAESIKAKGTTFECNVARNGDIMCRTILHVDMKEIKKQMAKKREATKKMELTLWDMLD